MNERVPFGTHWLEFEPGPLIVVRFVGTYTRHDALRMAAVIRDRYPPGLRYFVIADALHLGSTDADARKQHVDWVLSRPPRAVATISSSIVTRTLGTLIQNAHQLLSGTKVPSIFCKTESEARSWLAEQMSQAAPPRDLAP